MTASKKIKTPTMQLPILSSVSDDDLKVFCQDTTRLTLSQIVDEVTVRERLSSKSELNNYSRQKLYTVRLALYPRTDYTAEHNINPESILLGIQKTFVPLLDKNILKQIKQNDKESKASVGDMGKARKVSAATTAKAVIDGEDAAEAEEGGAGGRGDEDGEGDEELKESAQDSDDDEEGAEAEGGEAEQDDDDDDDGFSKAFPESGSEVGDDSDDDDTPEAREKASRVDALARMKTIERKIASNSRYVDKVTFDKVDGEWCEFDLEVSHILRARSLFGNQTECCAYTSSRRERTNCSWSESLKDVVGLQSFTRSQVSLGAL